MADPREPDSAEKPGSATADDFLPCDLIIGMDEDLRAALQQATSPEERGLIWPAVAVNNGALALQDALLEIAEAIDKSRRSHEGHA